MLGIRKDIISGLVDTIDTCMDFAIGTSSGS